MTISVKRWPKNWIFARKTPLPFENRSLPFENPAVMFSLRTNVRKRDEGMTLSRRLFCITKTLHLWMQSRQNGVFPANKCWKKWWRHDAFEKMNLHNENCSPLNAITTKGFKVFMKNHYYICCNFHVAYFNKWTYPYTFN